MPINENMVQEIVQEVMAKMQIADAPTGKHGIFKEMNDAIEAAKKSQLIVKKMSMDQREKIITCIRKKIKENAEVKYVTAEFGGKNTIINYYTCLKETGANNEINTIYLGGQDQIIDLNYIVEAYGQKTNIDMDLKGAISGNCKKHFKGTIDFKKGAKKSKGNENEYCMLLSNKAKSIALPMLLCTEEDVEGNHGASMGDLDDATLFYLCSRGLSREEAERMVARARIDALNELVADEAVQKQVQEFMNQKR